MMTPIFGLLSSLVGYVAVVMESSYAPKGESKREARRAVAAARRDPWVFLRGHLRVGDRSRRRCEDGRPGDGTLRRFEGELDVGRAIDELRVGPLEPNPLEVVVDRVDAIPPLDFEWDIGPGEREVVEVGVLEELLDLPRDLRLAPRERAPHSAAHRDVVVAEVVLRDVDRARHRLKEVDAVDLEFRDLHVVEDLVLGPVDDASRHSGRRERDALRHELRLVDEEPLVREFDRDLVDARAGRLLVFDAGLEVLALLDRPAREPAVRELRGRDVRPAARRRPANAEAEFVQPGRGLDVRVEVERGRRGLTTRPRVARVRVGPEKSVLDEVRVAYAAAAREDEQLVRDGRRRHVAPLGAGRAPRALAREQDDAVISIEIGR